MDEDEFFIKSFYILSLPWQYMEYYDMVSTKTQDVRFHMDEIRPYCLLTLANNRDQIDHTTL